MEHKIKCVPIRLAWCLRCETLFEWLPHLYSSTKGEDTYPRCPACGSYRNTVDKCLVKRHAECYPKFKELKID